MSGIYSLLGGICGMFVLALEGGIPFRGGIDMGLGVRLQNYNEIYGPALVRAVKLESSAAKYPRVVIGNSLWEYLHVLLVAPWSHQQTAMVCVRCSVHRQHHTECYIPRRISG